MGDEEAGAMTEDDIPAILELLKTHTFASVGILYGAPDKYNAYQWVKRFLIANGIDHKQYVKRKAGRYVTPAQLIAQETDNRPKVIRTYYDKALKAMVKVYEHRWAAWR